MSALFNKGEEILDKVLVGMSGGVDSSVCAYQLVKNGYETAGVTLSLLKKASDGQNIADANAVCQKLNIKHYSVDLSEDFKAFVIDDFINEYIQGRTPNPCIVCNRNIKFGKMLKKANELGFDKIATGHYARIVEKNGRFLLYKAKDFTKDQSYVLYCLTQNQLANAIFPLGDYTKAQIREIACEQGFINANKKDSQDICFVPDGDYASFIEKTSDFVSQTGDYINLQGEKLGEHKGVIHYTIGQRKGLGIALGKPAFVVDKNAQTNQVVLGENSDLFHKKIVVDNVNFIPFDKLDGEMKVAVKIRYSQNENEAVIKPYQNGQVLIEFLQPQRAPSIGQAAVFYDGDMVVGGGKIVAVIE